jgi:hypothetical protein
MFSDLEWDVLTQGVIRDTRSSLCERHSLMFKYSWDIQKQAPSLPKVLNLPADHEIIRRVILIKSFNRMIPIFAKAP